MGDHAFQSGVRILREFQAHNFYFVELVQSVQATHMGAIGACFSSKTRCISRIGYREVRFF